MAGVLLAYFVEISRGPTIATSADATTSGKSRASRIENIP